MAMKRLLTFLYISRANQSCLLLHPSQIVSHFKNLEESKHIKFDQNYRKNYKVLWHQDILYKNIINEEPNDI
jgi:hypothetical protein